MKRSQRSYTPELRAEILALLKGGAAVKRIAREKGIPESSVRWWKTHPESAAPAEVRLKAEATIADQVAQLRSLYLARASENRAVATTSGYYAVLAAAKLTDVHQLLSGKPTEITEQTVTYAEPGALRKLALTVIEGGREEAS